MTNKALLPILLIVAVIGSLGFYLASSSNKSKISTPSEDSDIRYIESKLQEADNEDKNLTLDGIEDTETSPNTTTTDTNSDIDSELNEIDKELDANQDTTLDDLSDL